MNRLEEYLAGEGDRNEQDLIDELEDTARLDELSEKQPKFEEDCE